MSTEEPDKQPPPLEARFLALNLRLSILENLHANLSERVDDIEDELDELWEAKNNFKRKSEKSP